MFSQISRRILTKGRSTRVFSAVTQSGAAPPSVFDSIVTLNFVDPSGARRQVPAYVGEFYYYWNNVFHFGWNIHFPYSPQIFLSCVTNRKKHLRNRGNE